MSEIQLCKVGTYLPIAKLKPHPNNPRTIKPERLKELKQSIIEKGFYEPILVWKKNGVVLSGNHRLRAAKELIEEGYEFTSPKGEKNVLPVVIEAVSDEVADSILYETNNSYAEWIEDKLRDALKDASSAQVTAAGFTQEYIDGLMIEAKKSVDEALSDSDFEAEVAKKTEREPVEEEKLTPLMLPNHVHEELVMILGDIAQAINDSWMPGNSYTEAVQVLTQALRESGFIDSLKEDLKPKEEKPKKKR